ncbi:hypothetical protein ACRV2W_004429 [Vibrio alginolyticus]
MKKITNWLNCRYEELVQNSSFTSLIGGNTLQFEPELDDRYDLVCYDDKVDMIFNQNKELTFFIASFPLDNKLLDLLSDDKINMRDLNNLDSVLATLGTADKEVGPRKLPGVIKNGWLQYQLDDAVDLTFTISHSDPKQIIDVRLSTRSSL